MPCVTLVVHGTKCVFVFVGFSGGVVGIICLCLFDCVLVHIICAVCYAGRARYKVCICFCGVFWGCCWYYLFVFV